MRRHFYRIFYAVHGNSALLRNSSEFKWAINTGLWLSCGTGCGGRERNAFPEGGREVDRQDGDAAPERNGVGETAPCLECARNDSKGID